MQVQTISTIILTIKVKLIDGDYLDFDFNCITKTCFAWILYVTHNRSIRSTDLIKAHIDSSVFNTCTRMLCTHYRRVDGPNSIRLKAHNRSLIIALGVNTCRRRANTSAATNRRHDKPISLKIRAHVYCLNDGRTPVCVS